MNARSIGDSPDMITGVGSNYMFQAVIFFTVISQLLIVQYGGDFTKTAPLSTEQWIRTITLASVTLPLGIIMRFIPVSEDSNDFALVSCGNVKSMQGNNSQSKKETSPVKQAVEMKRETRSTRKAKKTE